MFRELVTLDRVEVLENALRLLETQIGAAADSSPIWVCYGSFVLDQLTETSDIDLLRISTKGGYAIPTRVQAAYEGRPVTIYVLTLSDFLADGIAKKFGGYFAGKLLSPHLICPHSAEYDVLVQRVVGSFIGPFAKASSAQYRTKEGASPDQITADCLLAMLRLCPWYDAYLVRYFENARFDDIWRILAAFTTASLCAAEQVHRESDVSYSYITDISAEEIHRELVKCIARFWAIGVSLHQCRPDFPDYYFGKAEQYLSTSDLTARATQMLEFLRTKASEQQR